MSLIEQFSPAQLKIAEQRLEKEIRRRQEKKLQAQRGWIDKNGVLQGGLMAFIRYFWHILEPSTPLVEGWPLYAICLHLEAVTFGEISRLLITVPPGFMKSLCTDVFQPAWEWGPMGMAHMRYVAFSYSASLTERDNDRFRDLICHDDFKYLWGGKFDVTKVGVTKIANTKKGWKLASSVGGVGTGERGNRIILDDAHNIKEAESEVVRSETVRWFRESMSDRLNDMSEGSIIVIMQRSHDLDVAGAILELELPYVHLMIKMEYDSALPSETEIGWRDPREQDGELAWVKRFPPETVESIKIVKGSYAYAGQYQQMPVPRGGGIIKTDSWQVWNREKFPDCEYILASLDTAYTEKEENDASALTIWGVFRKQDAPKAMLLGAWEGRLELHDLVTLVAPICGAQVTEKELGEALELYNRGAVPATMLPRLPVDKLIIEAKASGLSVGQEMSRLYGNKGSFNVELVDPKKWGDKTSRLVAIEPMFADDMVYAPVMLDGGEYRWVRRVIDNVAAAPKTTKWDTPDSVSMALRYLRVVGLLKMRTEASADMMDAMQFRPRQKALYD